ncbi:hypothetical protein GCM10009801_78200 [Streptomyces albiaxialis]|uniref:GerMN domain-containing protein n=1 Tax=Streptomyces albiaxialis TaxID=329523 RepID=A0ABP5IRS0_9ACTN
MLLAALLVLPLAPVTACGIGDTSPGAAGPPAGGLPEADRRPASAVHLYFYSATGLERVSRSYAGPDRPQAAMDRLAQGPDAAERARGLISFLPDGPTPQVATGEGTGTGERGAVEVTVVSGEHTSRTAVRQIVCTAAAAVGSAQDRRPEDVEVRVRRLADGTLTTEVCAE